MATYWLHHYNRRITVVEAGDITEAITTAENYQHSAVHNGRAVDATELATGLADFTLKPLTDDIRGEA